jgi:hypothetical protein
MDQFRSHDGESVHVGQTFGGDNARVNDGDVALYVSQWRI